MSPGAFSSLNAASSLSDMSGASAGNSSWPGTGSNRVRGGGLNTNPRLVEVREKVLKQNDFLARSLRAKFRDAGVYVVSLVSSPGSGKTMFLEKLLSELSKDRRVAALVGDLATENDALRLARATPQVKQITTGTICHLDASMIERALADWDLENLDYLFIENVGNLVCPSSYDLGEELRFVLLSATEGEDKPLKYPTIFNSADLAIITKMDIAAACEFDVEAARRNIQNVRPGMEILEVSAKTGVGMNTVTGFLTLRELPVRRSG
jgi:hydrogenase nickel incorporation protein HypB